MGSCTIKNSKAQQGSSEDHQKIEVSHCGAIKKAAKAPIHAVL